MELGRLEEAVRCCHDVLALNPGQRTALAALGRLCARTANWEGLLDAFRAEAEAARDPHERAQRTYKAAQVLEEHLAKPDEAALAYRSALAQDPELLAARSALERLLEREGHWEELCHLIEGDLVALSPAEKVESLFRLARIEEERRLDGAAAIARYRQILELEPGNAAALRSLRATLERLGRGPELCEVLQLEASRLEDPLRRLALLQRRAEVFEELCQDPARAVEAWEELRRLYPDHLPALRALGRLHAASSNFGAVVELFHAQAASVRDPTQAAELLFRAADLEEHRLGRPEAAVPLYREVLVLLPDHLPSLQSLSRIHRARGEHAALAEVLSALAAAREAPAERAAALAELGELCEQRLLDLPRALAAYEDALAADPRGETTLRACERLYLETGRVRELSQLQRAALADETVQDRPARLLRLAWFEILKGGDLAVAAKAKEEVAKAAPDSPAIAILSLRLAKDPAERAAALAELAGPGPSPNPASSLPPGAPGVDPAELARACDARLAAAEDPGSRAAWAVQAGEAWERAGDPERAVAAYQQAMAASPTHLPALRAARHLFAEKRDWGAVRSTLQAEGDALLDRHDAAAAWREAGVIAEQWFGDVEGAVRDYRAALRRNPSDPVALTRVEALLAPAGLSELALVHAARAEDEGNPQRSADAWLAAARARLDTPGGTRAALEDLDRALDRFADHRPALELRARLRAQIGQPVQALRDLERCLSMGGDPGPQVPLHLSAAALCEEDLHDPSAALRHVEAALALSPQSAEALSRLVRLHRSAGRQASAAGALRRLLAVPGLPRQEQVENGFLLATLEAELDEVDLSLASCRQVLDADPGHPGALKLRVALERRRGDSNELAAALDAAAAGARDPNMRTDALLEAARLNAGPLGSRSRAVEQLRAALEIEPERDDIRGTLAEAAEEGQPLLALEQHRRLLMKEPFRLSSWSALFRLFGRLRSHDGAYVAATVLRYLGAPTPGRLRSSCSWRATPGAPRSAALVAGRIRAASSPGRLRALPAVVAIAGTLCPPSSPIPARPAARLSAPTTPSAAPWPTWRGPWALAPSSSTPPRWVASPSTGDSAAVRVGADLDHRLTMREQRFMLGRAAARLRTRSALVEAFPAEFADAVGAAVRAVVPGYTGLGHPGSELDRLVERAMTRRLRAPWRSRPESSPISGRPPTCPPGAPPAPPPPTGRASCSGRPAHLPRPPAGTRPGGSRPFSTGWRSSAAGPRPSPCSPTPRRKPTSPFARSSGWPRLKATGPRSGHDPSVRRTQSRGSTSSRACRAALTFSPSRDSRVTRTRWSAPSSNRGSADLHRRVERGHPGKRLGEPLLAHREVDRPEVKGLAFDERRHLLELVAEEARGAGQHEHVLDRRGGVGGLPTSRVPRARPPCEARPRAARPPRGGAGAGRGWPPPAGPGGRAGGRALPRPPKG